MYKIHSVLPLSNWPPHLSKYEHLRKADEISATESEITVYTLQWKPEGRQNYLKPELDVSLNESVETSFCKNQDSQPSRYNK